MSKEIKIIVENKLLMEMRYLNAYHSTRSAHIISYGSALTLPLGDSNTKDYIQISSHNESNYHICSDCFIDLPSWMNFEFLSEGKVILIHIKGRTVIKILTGPPIWQLKITSPVGFKMTRTEDYICVTDDKSKVEEI